MFTALNPPRRGTMLALLSPDLLSLTDATSKAGCGLCCADARATGVAIMAKGKRMSFHMLFILVP